MPCRHIPGYPKIDQRNSYLIGRFDGVVLDGKPWAGGDEYGGMAWPPVGLGEGMAALMMQNDPLWRQWRC